MFGSKKNDSNTSQTSNEVIDTEDDKIRKKMEEEKKKKLEEGDPKKIIKIEDAVTKKREKEDKGIFALGLISTILENNYIETVIETGEKINRYNAGSD